MYLLTVRFWSEPFPMALGLDFKELLFKLLHELLDLVSTLGSALELGVHFKY